MQAMCKKQEQKNDEGRGNYDSGVNPPNWIDASGLNILYPEGDPCYFG